jgi:hypothetical protein
MALQRLDPIAKKVGLGVKEVSDNSGYHILNIAGTNYINIKSLTLAAVSTIRPPIMMPLSFTLQNVCLHENGGRGPQVTPTLRPYDAF